MTAPTITPLPAAPNREQPGDDYAETASLWAAALNDNVDEFNEVIPYFSKLGLVLAAAESSTSVTPALIADANGDWSIPMTSGEWYRVLVLGTYQTAATTTGGILNVTAASGTAVVNGYFLAALTNTIVATGNEQTIAALPATFTTPSVSAINTPHHIRAEFVVVCTGTGVLEVRWGSEVGASAAQLNAGSALLVERI